MILDDILNQILEVLYKADYESKSIVAIVKSDLDLDYSFDKIKAICKKLVQENLIVIETDKYDVVGKITYQGAEYIEKYMSEKKDQQTLLNQVKKFHDSNIDQIWKYTDFKSELGSALLDYNMINKGIFLSELKRILQNNMESHSKVCKEPSNCSQSLFYPDAIFHVNQELLDLNNSNTNYSSYQPSDKFTDDESSKINHKLDEVLKRLERVELGQQITYDDLIKEISELKELKHVIGKKNWKEVFMGKLADWGINKALDPKVLGSIYKIVTGEELDLIQE